MGLIQRWNPRESCAVGVWAITESEEALRALQPGFPAELERLVGIASEQKRREHLAARAAFRALDDNYSALEITRDANGKPRVPGALHLSLAHSYPYAGAATALQEAVAIDLETIQPRNLELHRMFMNPDEIAWWKRHPTVEHMLAVWSAKEVLYKLFSRRFEGLSFRRELAVDLRPWRENAREQSLSATVCRAGSCYPVALHQWFVAVELAPAYWVSVGWTAPAYLVP